jgi:hypothetical protein
MDNPEYIADTLKQTVLVNNPEFIADTFKQTVGPQKPSNR